MFFFNIQEIITKKILKELFAIKIYRVENEEIEDVIDYEIYDDIDEVVEVEERVLSRKKRGTTAYNSDLAGCGGTFR